MNRRRRNPAYEKFYRDYHGETDPDTRAEIPEDAARMGAIRRRIEDLTEGLRLDRDIFGEIWDE